MKKNILIVLLAIVAFSCNTDDNTPETVIIESTLIGKGDLFGDGSEGIIKQNLVITDQTTWESLITKMNSVNNTSDRFSETTINFSEYKIIAVFDDIKANGGHDLVLDITTNSGVMIVKITDIIPPGNATTVITQPFHIVKIANSDLPIVFE